MGPVLDFMGPPAGGGTPPTPVQPAQPQPTKPPEPVKEPEPEPPKKEVRREIPKETEKEKGSLPVPVKTEKKETKEPIKPKSLVSTTVVKRSNVVDKAAMRLAQLQREKDAREAREAQERRNQAISDIKGILSDVNSGVSRSTVVSPGGVGSSGGGGAAAGRYGDGLKAIYDSKWILNADMYNDETATTVKVTVRRDGTVVSAVVTKSSGNTAFDRSVRSALNAVSRVQPFPSKMKDSEQEFTWRFERRTRVG